MATTIEGASGAIREARTRGRRETVRPALLACGALSSLLYVVATDGIGATQWAGYDRARQMVSDLFAIGSPARATLVPFVVAGYTLLMVAFGVGIWVSAHGDRRIRFTGACLAAYGLSNVVAACFPLTLGNSESVPMHIVATNLNLTFMLASIVCAAVAFPGRFRTYSLSTIAIATVAGLVAFASAPAGPSLGLGIGERISIWAFLLWVVVLPVAVGRSGESAADGQPRRGLFGRMYDWVYERCSTPAAR